MTRGALAPLIREHYPQYYQWCEYPAEECVPIRRVAELWGVLGNFAPTPLEVEDITYSCSEQLFQMMKFTDPEVLRAIYAAKGLPLKWAAKKAEREGHRRPDWGQIVVDCMKFCLQTKFEQSEVFRQTLAETADRYIVEDQTSLKTTRSGLLRDADTWGAVLRGDKFIGPNLLGRLLMELRDQGYLSFNLPEPRLSF